MDGVSHGGSCSELLEVPPEERLGLREERALDEAQHERQPDPPVAQKFPFKCTDKRLSFEYSQVMFEAHHIRLKQAHCSLSSNKNSTTRH